MAKDDKKTNEKEQTFEGCYGAQVTYTELDQFIADVFEMNREAEDDGLDERFATCIWGHAGIGKCVAGDTLVVSDGGIHRIDDVFDGPEPDSEHEAVGMKVHTPTIGNSMKDVGFLYFAGAKPSVGIRTSYGRELVGSLVHGVKVLREDGLRFVPLSLVSIGDMVVVDWIRSDREDAKLPELRVGHRNLKLDFSVPGVMTEELAFILGALVGEGDKRSHHSVVFCQDRTKPLAKKYVEYVRKTFGLACNEELDPRTENTCNYRIHRTALREWLADIGLDYVDSHGATVPVSVLRSSKKVQLAFIRALYEAEADSSGSGICLSSVSKRLLQEVQMMLLQFEVAASLYPKDVKRTSWRLMVSGKYARRLFGLIQLSRIDKTDRWLRETETDYSNKDGVPAAWAYSFLRKMKESHLANGGHLTKRAIHSYPLNNLYSRSVAVDRDGGRKMWTADKVRGIAKMLGMADESYRTHLEYMLSFRYEAVVDVWDNGVVPLYDLNVPDGNEFDANGIVVHNTAKVKQHCKKPVEWKGTKYEGYAVFDVPIAQFEEMGDLHGMPARHVMVAKGKEQVWVPEEVLSGYAKDGWQMVHSAGVRTMYAPPDWVPSVPGPSILLLDDWNRASVRIIKGIMQLLQNYGMVSWKLPPGCNIVLTGNPDEQDYLVTSIDAAILTRIRSVTLKHDAKEWAVWATEVGLDPRGINFVLQYPEMMVGPERTNPRTLAQFFRDMKRVPDLRSEVNQQRFRTMACSLLDEQTVSSLTVFMERDVELAIEPEQILNAKEWNFIEKHVEKLMSGREKRVDVLGVMCDRMYAHLVQPKVKPEKKAIENFQRFITMEQLPEDMRHNLCLRLARVKDNGKTHQWILHNEKLTKLIVAVL